MMFRIYMRRILVNFRRKGFNTDFYKMWKAKLIRVVKIQKLYCCIIYVAYIWNRYADAYTSMLAPTHAWLSKSPFGTLLYFTPQSTLWNIHVMRVLRRTLRRTKFKMEQNSLWTSNSQSTICSMKSTIKWSKNYADYGQFGHGSKVMVVCLICLYGRISSIFY